MLLERIYFLQQWQATRRQDKADTWRKYKNFKAQFPVNLRDRHILSLSHAAKDVAFSIQPMGNQDLYLKQLAGNLQIFLYSTEQMQVIYHKLLNNFK